MNSLNKLLADLNVLNTKLHTYHYNVVGIDFYQTHVFLEEEYDKVFDLIDGVAEAIKQEGGYPLASLKEMLEIASINEVSSKDITSKEVYTDLVKDYESILAQVISISEEDLKPSTLNLMDDIINEFSKKVWFLSASIK